MSRKFSALCLIFTLGVAGAAVALLEMGWGMRGSATTTTGRASGFTVNQLSIYNKDTAQTLFVLVNCTTNEFNAARLLTNCVPVPPNSTFTFDCNSRASIDSLCYSTTNGTVAFDAGGF